MIISNKQIMQLIGVAENLRVKLLDEGDQHGYKAVTELVADITMQQSEELKEIE